MDDKDSKEAVEVELLQRTVKIGPVVEEVRETNKNVPDGVRTYPEYDPGSIVVPMGRVGFRPIGCQTVLASGPLVTTGCSGV